MQFVIQNNQRRSLKILNRVSIKLKTKQMINLIFLLTSVVSLIFCGVELLEKKIIKQSLFINLVISLTLFLLTLKY